MVRTYKKKGKYGQYSPDVIDAAVSAVKNKLMSVREASKEFGIPPTTIHNWVHNKVTNIRFSSKCRPSLLTTLKGLKW